MAFEHLVVRDWNDALCGVCGYHPHALVADGNAKMVMKLRGVELSVEGAPPGPNVIDSDAYFTDLENKAILFLRFPSRGIMNDKIIRLHEVAAFVPSQHLGGKMVCPTSAVRPRPDAFDARAVPRG